MREKKFGTLHEFGFYCVLFDSLKVKTAAF